MDVANMPNIVPMEEREWFVLFAICVAGKSAKQTQRKINDYLHLYNSRLTPFQIVQQDVTAGVLHVALRTHKMGQYKRIEKAFTEVSKLDVAKDLTISKLEAIPGIGPKTARFIVLYTCPNADCVPLDTHILKYLAKEFPDKKVPKSTPPKGNKYNELEALFQECAEIRGVSVRELDTEIWQSYAYAK